MTELEISIGGRVFSVACDNEEQEKVREAASLINEEADAIQSTLGRLPESKMLLLSALMIADRLVDLESESKVFKEKSTDRRMIKEKIKELDLNIESIKKFKNSENCEVNGVLIDYNDVTTQGNQPRTYAYCADSQYDENIISYLENVDLIYHESTFLESKMDKAIKTKHSTAKQAATIALKANAKQLIIGHFSARYDNSDQFLEEAKVVFNQTITAYDGYTHQIKIEN